MLVGGKEMLTSHSYDPANGCQVGQLNDVGGKLKRNGRFPTINLNVASGTRSAQRQRWTSLTFSAPHISPWSSGVSYIRLCTRRAPSFLIMPHSLEEIPRKQKVASRNTAPSRPPGRSTRGPANLCQMCFRITSDQPRQLVGSASSLQAHNPRSLLSLRSRPSSTNDGLVR
jgi:hypothetical protein